MGEYTDPDWANAALLTIDTQRDFTLPGAPAEIAGTMEVLPSMRRLLQGFRSRGRPVIHVVRLYLPDGSNADLCRKESVEKGESVVVTPGSAGAELMQELKPSSSITLDAGLLLEGELQRVADNEWIMYKPRWGAFYETPLQEHLLGLGVNTVVVSGCNFPNCPRATVYEASERDFRVVLVSDAVSGLYERGTRELENIGVEPLDTEACLEGLAASDPVRSG